MAAATTTFDRHYEGKLLLTEVPNGVDTKTFDWHYEGMAIVADEEAAAGGLDISIAMHHYQQMAGAN